MGDKTVTERRLSPRPKSTLRRILDITYAQIRKTMKFSDCFKVTTNV